MGYRTRPRYQAQIHSRPEERDSTPASGGTPSAPTGHSSAPNGIFSAPKPEGRWEPRQVLDALHEMHNAPAEKPVHGRRGGG